MIFFIFCIGLCVGSFLNVCIYRLPKNISIVNPPSFCPRCNIPIKWLDNIPLFSFFILGRACRQCKEFISWKYPAVEALTGLIFIFLYIHFGPTTDFVKYVFFFSLLIVISFIDIEYRAIPAYLCLIGIIAGLLSAFGESIYLLKQDYLDLMSLPVTRSLKGLIFGLGFAYMFKFFGDFFVAILLQVRKKQTIDGETESLGLGDVDFLGMAGVFLGTKGAILTFFIAPIIALGYAVFALIFKRSHVIAYLPYLSIAALVVLFFGDNFFKLIF